MMKDINVIIDYKNTVNILKKKKVKEKKVVFFIYENEKEAYEAMYKTFSLIKHDEFAMLSCKIDEFKLKILKSNMELNNLIKHGEFAKKVLITDINLENDTIELKEISYDNEEDLKEVIEYFEQRYRMVRGKEIE